MRVLLFVVAFFTCSVLVPSSPLSAQGDGDILPSLDSSYDPVVMPEMVTTSVVIDSDDKEPVEPNLGEVAFRRVPAYNNFEQRVDTLIHGINKDLAPEFDHYGYGIRRYMARVGNSKIYTDQKYLIQQIKNVRKARVIVTYWKKHLDKEVAEIDEIISNDETVSFATRTAFKQNKAIVTTFLIVLAAWVDSNEQLLMKIYEDPSIYELYYPEVIIQVNQLRISFYNALVVRQTKLKEIRGYHPFTMMVY